jgi:hypothetical protein
MAISSRRSVTLRFRSGAASVRDLQAEVSSALAELADPDSGLAQAAAGLGMAPHEFAGASGSVEQEGKGFGDVIMIVAILAPAANHALRNVWDDLVWPKIKSRLGADALGHAAPADEIDKSDSDEDDEK